MSREQAQQFVQEATLAIQSGNPAAGIELLERSLALEPSLVDAHTLTGVAQSMLKHNEEAVGAFRAALAIAPKNPKALYNFAVHCYGVGDKEQALELAHEALAADAGHSQAAELAKRIEIEKGASPASETAATPELDVPPIVAPQRPLPHAEYYRGEAYAYDHPVHSLAFVQNMGGFWDVIGWSLAAGGAVFTVWSIVLASKNMTQLLSDPVHYSSALVNPIVRFGYLIFGSLTLLWMSFELSDRRGNFLWMLPTILSCCCMGNFLVPAIYLLGGRSR